MPNPTLLADLTWRLASSPEDVATDALTLILGRSAAAREAMNGLIHQWCGSPACVVARWKTQVVAADASRTDMEGEDASGVVRVIFENKFWAGLTQNQPGTYLRRLPADRGLLAFVVPTMRLTQIEFELTHRALAEGFGPLEFRPAGASRAANASPTQTLAVTTWDVVLTNIASALEVAQDHTALADIRQLQGLTERVDTEAFLPFTATDITGPTPRVLIQCYKLVDAVKPILIRNPAVNRQGLGDAVGPGHYGPNFRFHGFGCTFLFSAPRWQKLGVSPLWLRVATSDWKFPEGLHAPIAAVLPDPTLLREEATGSSPGLWLPLRLLEGRERDVVVEDVLRQILEVGRVLETHAALASPPEPPSIALT